MIKLIIFDFDGVLVESVELKGKAFEMLFAEEPISIRKQIVKYHLENGGVSRYEKIEYIYKNILNKPLTEEKYQQLLKKFSEIVVDLVCKAEEVKGTRDFLEKYYNKIPLYVVSATPKGELEHIIQKRGMQKYFKGIYGIPPEKHETVNRIIANEKVTPEETLYIGDSASDLRVAEKTRVNFILRKTGNNKHLEICVNFKVNNMQELSKVVRVFD